MEKIEIKDGQVWSSETAQQYRRIIGQLDGHIVYCVGADSHRICKDETFRRWVREAEAMVANPVAENCAQV